jgi:Tfp pilus assembly protein FimT
MGNLSLLSFPASKILMPLAGHDSGLTLLELMIVFVLTAILAALAFPDLSGFMTRRALFDQTDRLSLIINRTRDMAMEHNCPWRMIFNPGKGSWLCYGDADDDGKQDAGEGTMGPFTLEKGIFFGSLAGSGPNKTSIPGDGVSFTENQVCFSPMGTCNSGSIYLTDRHFSTAVRVMPASGSVRVWHYRSAWKEI